MQVGVSARVFDRNVGGNSTYARELYERLSNLGVRRIPFAQGPIGPDWLPLGARYIWREACQPLRGDTELDLIHYPADTGPIARGRTPITVTIHGDASRNIRGVRGPVMQRIWKARTGAAAHCAKEIITTSRSSANDLIRSFDIPARKVTIIHHGIDPARFNTDGSRDAAILEPFGLPDLFALYLGNLDPRKNLSRSLDAFESNALRSIGLSFVVAGAHAWGTESLIARMQTMSNVQYLGRVESQAVPALMRQASVFVFPSLYEGFGFPVIEAMACGTPVITSNRGALHEIVNGAARVIDPVSSRSIAEAIGEVVNDDHLSRELKAAGISNAQRFDWNASAKAHLAVFERVAGAAK